MREYIIHIIAALLFGLMSSDAHTAMKAIWEKREELSFANIKRQVLVPACIECHEFEDDPPFTTYDQITPWLEDIRVRVFEDRDMPPEDEPQLSSKQKKLLKKWLDAGAPE